MNCADKYDGKLGVPDMAQWVKNPTAAAWVAVEVQVRSSQAQHRFNLWPRYFHMPWVQPLKKTANLIIFFCECSDCSINWPVPKLSPSRWASLFLKTQQN